MTIIPCQRAAFAIPRDIHYFNCAYMGPLPLAVSAAVAAGAAIKASPWTYRPADFFTQIEGYRTRAARLIGSTVNEIALVPSASYALAIAAKNLPLAAGAKHRRARRTIPLQLLLLDRKGRCRSRLGLHRTA